MTSIPPPIQGPTEGKEITKGPVERLTQPRAQQKSSGLKGNLISEGNPFINPRASTKWARNCKNSYWSWRNWYVSFLTVSFHLGSAGRGKVQMFFSPLLRLPWALDSYQLQPCQSKPNMICPSFPTTTAQAIPPRQP